MTSPTACRVAQRPVSGLASEGRNSCASGPRLPMREHSGCDADRLLAYRCGGSSGIAGRACTTRRTGFPFQPPAKPAVTSGAGILAAVRRPARRRGMAIGHVEVVDRSHSAVPSRRKASEAGDRAKALPPSRPIACGDAALPSLPASPSMQRTTLTFRHSSKSRSMLPGKPQEPDSTIAARPASSGN